GTRSTAKVCLPGGQSEPVHTLDVGPRFFQTMGIRLLAGRDFNNRDRRTSARVAIVNEAFARRLVPTSLPIRQTLNILPPKDQVTCPSTGELAEVIGVVSDAKYDDLRSEAPPTVYLAYFQNDVRWATFEVAAANEPTALVSPIRKLMATIDPNVFM